MTDRLVAFLVSGAAWVLLYQLFGRPVVVVIAVLAVALICIAVAHDVTRTARDRSVALRRWESWHG